MARRRWNYESIQQVLDDQNPFVQVGYAPAEDRHKAGDVWTDPRGDTWEQRSGYKIKVNSQADSIRDLVKRKCKKCGIDIDTFGSRYDENFFGKTGWCEDCLMMEETAMRATGKYEQYEKNKILHNQFSALKELRDNILVSIEYLKKDDSKLSWVTSQGDVVTWTGSENEAILKGAEADLIKINEDIKIVEKELNELNNEVKTVNK